MPLDFVNASISMFINKDLNLETLINIILPNVSFDYYRISNLTVEKVPEAKNHTFSTGFITIDSSQRIKIL